jgi:hypothetical protein
MPDQPVFDFVLKEQKEIPSENDNSNSNLKYLEVVDNSSKLNPAIRYNQENANDASKFPMADFPYAQNILGSLSRDNAHVNETEPISIGYDGNIKYSRQIDLNDGNVWDTKFQENVFVGKNGQVQKVEIDFGETKTLKFGVGAEQFEINVDKLNIERTEDDLFKISVPLGEGRADKVFYTDNKGNIAMDEYHNLKQLGEKGVFKLIAGDLNQLSMEQIKKANPEKLVLNLTCVSQEGLNRLQELSSIPQLELNIDIPYNGPVIELKKGADELSADALKSIENMGNIHALSISLEKHPVTFEPVYVSSKSLAVVSSLKNLEHFSLRDAQLDSNSLEGVSKLPQLKSFALETIDLNWAPDALQHISNMRNLGELSMNVVSLKENDIRNIASLNNLSKLKLRAADLTDSHIENLLPMDNLEHLNISGNPITDVALARISKQSDLKVLNISHTLITDKGLEHLKALNDLTSLDIYATRITDNGLKSLLDMESLRYLNVKYTTVSSQGMKVLLQHPSLKEVICTLEGVQSTLGKEFRYAKKMLVTAS